MGKYGKALGIWDITIGGADLEVKPKTGDNKKLMKIMSNKEFKNREDLKLEAIMKFLVELISRDNPPVTEEEKEELEQYVEFNITKLIDELLIAFNWQTKEELERNKKEAAGQIKNLIGES